MSSPSSGAQPSLQYFPITFFALIMGMSGLTLAWQKAQAVLGLDWDVALLLLGVTATVFVLLIAALVLKSLRYIEAVKAELLHPVKVSFFPAISISCMLMGAAFATRAPAFGQLLWVLGAVAHFGLTLYVIGAWMGRGTFKIQHMNPAWFIPAVGNVVAPIGGVGFGFFEVSWFFFSVGMLFWLVLLTIVFNRILFHDPIEARLMPSLFILIAPPAVGFVSYCHLQPELDNFGRFLFFAGLFLTFLLISQFRRFLNLPFALSWWAYSFPSAAMTIATFVMYERTQVAGYQTLAIVFLAAMTALIAYLFWRTLRVTWAAKVFLPEG